MKDEQTALRKHAEWAGKIEVHCSVPLETRDDLSLAYTPGVAQPCLAIEQDESLSFTLTRRHNLCLVVTDGTAVLGLGDIGPAAAMPVMEGKCALFKAFADVDAFPLCIDSKDVDTIVDTIALISKSFGGINLEDIAAPRCFEIEAKLKQRCDIPVFHDDQHGTAIVVAAALLNVCTLLQKDAASLRIVVNGAGAAGISITRLLAGMGFGDITPCDIEGAITKDSTWANEAQRAAAGTANKQNRSGSLADVLSGADVFIGVSRPGLLTADMVRSMAPQPTVFAMANPTPEIMPDEAKAGGAAIVATGRSDFPNQVNNLLAFPGIFRGALDVRASDINLSMMQAAAQALSAYIPRAELGYENILPSALDKGVAPAVAKAVAQAARTSGVARI